MSGRYISYGLTYEMSHSKRNFIPMSKPIGFLHEVSNAFASVCPVSAVSAIYTLYPFVCVTGITFIFAKTVDSLTLFADRVRFWCLHSLLSLTALNCLRFLSSWYTSVGQSGDIRIQQSTLLTRLLMCSKDQRLRDEE